jgi:adenylate cyclase
LIEHPGMLNQYMGDGIMVIFGAPVVCPDHALRAVCSAVAMVRRVHDLKETWAKLGMPDLRIGVGIHTGKGIVGTLGSPSRQDYTAIGDTVNAAARIEAENKTFGTEILISSETREVLTAEERKQLGCADQPRQAEGKGKAEKLSLYPVTVVEARDRRQGPSRSSLLR